MNSPISFPVPAQDAGKRLDVFLSQRGPSLTRSGVKRLIEQGNVQLGGKKAKAGIRLKERDVVLLTLPPLRPMEAQAEEIPLHILFEDSHLIVVDKAAGMVVHPAAGHFSGTLVNALLHHCPDLGGIGGVLRPGIVHRLDKDTSGVLVVAKTDLAHRGLAHQFKNHTPARQYLGICFGQLADEGQMEASIGRHPVHRQKMSTRTRKGRVARTHWKVLERFRHFNLVELRLETGRTHQIRVHLSSLGHPILGDPVYGGRKGLASVEPPLLRERLEKIRRQALHAASLGFIHPVTGEKMAFRSPLPADMEEALDALRRLDQEQKR
jgi:23S rRNA pseudouridine1911/1915/1917 synthase